MIQAASVIRLAKAVCFFLQLRENVIFHLTFPPNLDIVYLLLSY